MVESLNAMSTNQAAEYCHVRPRTIRHHVYVRKDLKPDINTTRRLFFFASTLDAWIKTRNPRGGRPRIHPVVEKKVKPLHKVRALSANDLEVERLKKLRQRIRI